MPTPDFRTILADETREAHDAIERALDLGPDAPFERYLSYLRGMHAVVASAETAFERDLRLADLGLMPSPMRARLERDIAYFRLEPMACRVALPGDLPSRVGWAYVLEGASLGGRVLHARLAPRWSLTPATGGAFLAGHAQRSGEGWRRFVHALNRVPFTAEEKKACVAGARQAFGAIAETFRASVACAGLGLAGQDGFRTGTSREQPPARAIERTDSQQREQRFDEG